MCYFDIGVISLHTLVSMCSKAGEIVKFRSHGASDACKDDWKCKLALRMLAVLRMTGSNVDLYDSLFGYGLKRCATTLSYYNLISPLS